jgi:hypothetical protein
LRCGCFGIELPQHLLGSVMNLPAALNLDQLLLIAAIIVVIIVVWVAFRFVFKLAMRVFAFGCMLIVLIALALLALYFLGFIA